jgi:hypothetical protein
MLPPKLYEKNKQYDIDLILGYNLSGGRQGSL